MNDTVFKASPGLHIYRYEVPVDDQWHVHNLSGGPLYVAARRPDLVEFWALNYEDDDGIPRAFRVVGTGHELPNEDVRYVGSTIAASGVLVWHLLERWPSGRGVKS